MAVPGDLTCTLRQYKRYICSCRSEIKSDVRTQDLPAVYLNKIPRTIGVYVNRPRSPRVASTSLAAARYRSSQRCGRGSLEYLLYPSHHRIFRRLPPLPLQPCQTHQPGVTQQGMGGPPPPARIYVPVWIFCCPVGLPSGAPSSQRGLPLMPTRPRP